MRTDSSAADVRIYEHATVATGDADPQPFVDPHALGWRKPPDGAKMYRKAKAKVAGGVVDIEWTDADPPIEFGDAEAREYGRVTVPATEVSSVTVAMQDYKRRGSVTLFPHVYAPDGETSVEADAVETLGDGWIRVVFETGARSLLHELPPTAYGRVEWRPP
jgi:hypothetical protein